jgi:hypothetical protein
MLLRSAQVTGSADVSPRHSGENRIRGKPAVLYANVPTQLAIPILVRRSMNILFVSCIQCFAEPQQGKLLPSRVRREHELDTGARVELADEPSRHLS